MKKWSIVLAAAMALSLACPMGSLADDNPKAQYGTPVVDGKIDAVWNTTDKISVVWAGDETATRYNASDKPLKDSYCLLDTSRKKLRPVRHMEQHAVRHHHQPCLLYTSRCV